MLIGTTIFVAIMLTIFVIIPSLNPEKYTVEIHTFREDYVVGDNLEFYFVIYGTGYECGDIKILVANQDGVISTGHTEKTCPEDQLIKEFHYDSSENDEYYGVFLPDLGQYTISILYEPYGIWVTNSFDVKDKNP